MKRWTRNAIAGLSTLALSLGFANYVKAQSSPASYWGQAHDRGNAVEDSTIVRIYDTNGTGDGNTETGDDQLIGEALTFTYNDERGWFDIKAATDDPSTQEDEGAVDGANTYFKLVRKSDGKEDLAYSDADMTTHLVTHEELTTREHNLYTDFSVGMEPVNKKDIKIYPNPFSSELFIEDPFKAGEREFEVFDMSGRLVLMGRYETGEKVSVDVGGIASGVYIMRIKSGNNSVGAKVKVEKLVKR